MMKKGGKRGVSCDVTRASPRTQHVTLAKKEEEGERVNSRRQNTERETGEKEESAPAARQGGQPPPSVTSQPV